MNEVRRFLRYSLPGIACITQLLVALIISDSGKLNGFLPTSEAKQGIALVLAGLLASGGLGYLFSMLYFPLIKLPGVELVLAPEYKELLRRLLNARLIEIRDEANKDVQINPLSRDAAWALVTCYFHSRKGCPQIKNVMAYVKQLIDVMHANGSTILGTFCIAASWVVIHLAVFGNPWSRLCSTVCVVWAVVLSGMIFHQIKLVRAVQSIVSITLVEAIRRDHAKTGQTVTIWYAK